MKSELKVARISNPNDPLIDPWLKKLSVNNAPIRRMGIATSLTFFSRYHISADKAFEYLGGIDLSKPVQEIQCLPDRIYVQYVQKYKGIWFTSTGLTPDHVGIAEGNRTRKLFRPSGNVPALKSVARSIKDVWSADRLFTPLKPENIAKLNAKGKELMKTRQGQLTSGGGTQFIVLDNLRMKEV